MKRFVLMMAAAMMVSGAASAGAPERSLTIGSGAVRTVNDVPHRQVHERQGAFLLASRSGQTVTVPFKHTLCKGDETCNLYTAIDANGDGRGWKIGALSSYTACMGPNNDAIDSFDDWLMGPGVELKAGTEYTAKFDLGYMGTGATGTKLGLYLGAEPTVAGMTTAVKAPWVETKKDMTTYEATFTVAADGVYYFGFWACGTRTDSFGTVKLANFEVATGGGSDPVETVDPPAAGTIEYSVYPKGELKAHVVYTAPTLTVGGKELERIDKVLIVNRWYEKFEYTEVTPGQKIELDVELFQGGSNNRLEGTAYVNDSKGEPVAGPAVLVTGIWGGFDNPQPVTNAKATVSPDGSRVTVSWDAPGEVGEHGGYVDVNALTYFIFDAFGSYWDPALASTTDTHYEFDYSDLTKQDFVAFQITSSYDDDTYISLDTATNIVTVGKPDQLPFLESFPDAYYTNTWLTDPKSSYYVMAGTVTDNYLQTNASEPDAEPEYLNSQDGDNGFHYILPTEKDDMYGLISVKVDISKAVRPVLEFFYQGKGSALDVLVSTNGADFDTVRTIDLQAEPTDGWTLCRVDLAPYKDPGVLQFELRLRAIHNDDEHTWSVPFDNIRVRDLQDTDLRLASFTAPQRVAAPGAATLTARVENFGDKATPATIAVLARDGHNIDAIDIKALNPNEIAVLTYSDPIGLDAPDSVEYTLTLSYADDQNAANDELSCEVAVTMPPYPVPTGLEATLVGSTVELKWEPVDISGLTSSEPVTEDFENPDYEPFAYENIGDWITVDLDGQKNYTFLGDVNNPYRTMPMAWQLFNPYISGMDPEKYIDAMPHSGNTMLVAWSGEKTNCNVLISPRLSGEAQTITFWVKSFTIAWGESLWVYYSTTDTEIESFQAVDFITNYPAGTDVPEEWTELKVDLPEGAVYFSIVHDSFYTYALYLDDITYIPASTFGQDAKVTGYNVYCDGRLVGSTVEPAFTDTIDMVPGTLHYRVSACYGGDLESRHSDPVEVLVETVGIQAVGTDSQAPAEYFDLQGRRTDAKAPGIYIERRGSSASKRIVK